MFDEIGGEGVAKSGRVEVAGCLEMNDFEINFLDTQADGRPRDETDTFVSRGGERDAMNNGGCLSKFLKHATIAYRLRHQERKGRCNRLYTIATFPTLLCLLDTKVFLSSWMIG